VFDEEAGVFDDEEAGGAGFLGGGGVSDLLLEPEGFGVDGDGGIGDGRDVGRTAENVDDVDRFWDVFEAGIGFLAEDFGFVWVDGNDFVAGGLEIGGYLIRGAGRIGGEADDSDGFGLVEELGDRVGGGGGVIGEVEEHFTLMREIGRKIGEIWGGRKRRSGRVKE
jgi:hypothetical protein